MNETKPRVAIITGASSGIGKESAKILASSGWRIIGIGRNPERCAQAEHDIREASACGQVTFLKADLSIMSEVCRVAEEIQLATDRIDLLINNAGGMNATLQLTPDGHEATFASNHLAPFLLTQRLIPALQKAADTSATGATRIINVSSSAHESAKEIDWNNLQLLNNFHAPGAYCHAKLANLLFNHTLAKHLKSDGIAVLAVHPGVVRSNFSSHTDKATQGYLDSLEAITPEQAAQALICLATDPACAQHTGGYFDQRQLAQPSPAAQDDALASQMWQATSTLLRPFLPAGVS